MRRDPLHCGADVRYKQGMSKTPTRTSALARRATRYPLSMIEDGQLILELLVSLRFATGTQIQRVIFDRTSVSPRMARHRATRSLRRLFDAGLTRRVSVFAPSSTGRMSQQIVNVLSAAGAQAVGVDPRWARTRTPKDGAILIHDYWLMELAVLAMEGCPPPLTIERWWDDRILMARKRQGRLSLSNVPDGLLVIENLSSGKRFPCLVELDLGTESVVSPTRLRRDFARKIEGYLEYLGRSFRGEFELDAPPIVLIVTDSPRRLASLRQTTQRLGGRGRYWLVILDQLRRMPDANDQRDSPSAALHAPFWASNWQTAEEDGRRSLATRCGL